MHEIAGKAVCFKEAMLPSFKTYQQQVIDNAKALAKVLKDGGLKLVSGGTDNHLMLIDLTSLGISGQEAEKALGEIGLVANKNKIPFDEKSATVTSGIRLGTPNITSRGMGLLEMDILGNIILERLKNKQSVEALRKEVHKLAAAFMA